MKHLLLTTIAAVLLVGCIGVQESSSPADAKLTEHVSDAKPANSEADDALVNAGVSGDIEAVKLLIANGANVNAKDEEGFTPLDQAALWDHKEIADLLVEHGGKSGAADSIHVAAAVGNIEAVQQHLAAGEDVNAKDEFGYAPLHNAAWIGHKEIAELLVAKRCGCECGGRG